MNINTIRVQSSDVLSKYFGDTEAKLRKIFANARKSSPCILFFDEFDALAFKRYVITINQEISLVVLLLI